jgi:hypothetical protein
MPRSLAVWVVLVTKAVVDETKAAHAVVEKRLKQWWIRRGRRLELW